MSWTGSSFNLWNDSDLTDQFSGIISTIHKTDFTDNPQDFTLYLGSPLADRQLQATSNPGVDNITLTPSDITPKWANATAYVSGVKVQPVGGNGFIYQCTTSGTSGASEPTWPVVGIGTTVVDNTCIWELISIHHAPSEFILALSSGGLATNTPGAPLSLGNTIDSTIALAVPIYIRLVNAVSNVANNTGNPEIGIKRNAAIETVVP